MLKGAQEDELKRVKHGIQYGVFSAYHLALETSFLADEGASLPELPLQTPITVAWLHLINHQRLTDQYLALLFQVQKSLQLLNYWVSHIMPMATLPPWITVYSDITTSKDDGLVPTLEPRQLSFHMEEASVQKDQWSVLPCATEQVTDGAYTKESTVTGDQNDSRHEQVDSSKGDFLPTASDHQSILVSLSTRCVWKGSVCERAHLLRIKYYGSFDKPLGRFLRDNLFDQVPFIL